MKIYIATRGDYSSYHITAIFTSKEKADAWYAVHHKVDYDVNEIEEHDTDDDSKDVEQYVIGVSSLDGRVDVSVADDEYPEEPIDIYPERIVRNRIVTPMDVIVRRLVPIDCDLEYEKERVIKIATDTLAKCKTLMELEGFTFEQMKETIINEHKNESL